jgi:hypothetical protein
MRDLATVLWKEVREFLGNRRSLRIFLLVVLVFGAVPALGPLRVTGPDAAAVLPMVRTFYSLLATVIVVAQTAPDLVLRERVGRTFDWLLATRLPDRAIFLGKVLVAAMAGYVSGLLAFLVETVVANLRTGGAWNWGTFALPTGRILIFGAAAALAVYVAVIGTFVALKIAEQRSAYMVTVLSVALLAVPVVLQWVAVQFTATWLANATEVLGAADVALAVLGIRFFRRELLVLSLYG